MFALPLRSSNPDFLYGKYAASLFAAGEQGVWYDPSDFSTMFQDSAGTTPVTAVEQPVGLLLDKSRGMYGPQLIISPYTGAANSGWNISNAQINRAAGPGGITLNTNAAFKVGSLYEITLTVSDFSGDGLIIRLGNAYGTPWYPFTGNGNKKIIAQAISIGSFVWFAGVTGSAGTATITNISVRELPGNHARQTTTASRPVLSARVNLLTKTEQFDDSRWTKSNGINQPNSLVLPNVEIAPNNTLTADKLVEPFSVSPAVSNARIYVTNVPTTSGISHTFTIHAKAAERKYISIRLESGSNFGVLVDLETGNTFPGRYDGTNQPLPLSNVSVVNVGNGWWRISGTYTPTGNSLVILHCCETATTTAYTGDGTSGIYIWGADVRATNMGVGLPAYQRVNTATDYDTQGFPPYLRFDGVDDWLVTPSIDFTATDKITVFTGVRKFSDTVSTICELGTHWTTPNGFYLVSQLYGGVPYYSFAPRGNRIAVVNDETNVSTSTAPDSAVITSQVSMNAGTPAQIRRNAGSFQNSINTSFGGGNFGNHPVYIGRRNGTEYPFNGRLYGLIVRGAQTDDLHLTNVERYLANKSGVVL